VRPPLLLLVTGLRAAVAEPGKVKGLSKEVTMHGSRSALGLVLMAFAAGGAALAAGGEDKRAEAPQEETVVAYDSKTTGALQVKTVSEKTGEWFDVLQNGKGAVAGAPPKLNSTVELVPGAYVVSVNRTERKVTVEAGNKTVLLTGELVVEEAAGSGDFYAPYQGKECKLAGVQPVVNTPTALFAGKYTVKLFADKTRDLWEAEVTAGKRTVLKP
jgi:hypothetical protein